MLDNPGVPANLDGLEALAGARVVGIDPQRLLQRIHTPIEPLGVSCVLNSRTASPMAK